MKAILTTTLSLGLAAAGLLAFGIAAGDSDDDDHLGRAAQADPRYPLYAEECGACHLAYPAGMLPAASWGLMMDGLGDHFGDDATLADATAATIRAYLAEHAAGPGRGEYGERAWRATRGLAPPLRITETDYFVGKHHEVPMRLVSDNPEVVSFSRCTACHTAAERGDFDDDRVLIPGYGRWDD
jgi:hypothetical protein